MSLHPRRLLRYRFQEQQRVQLPGGPAVDHIVVIRASGVAGLPTGVQPVQVQVLIFLLHHGEEMRTISYLASEFDLTKATISDTVKALERKGLITKAYDKRDTRSYRIHLSETGEEVANRTALFTRGLSTPIEQMDTPAKENLLASLIGIIRYLNGAGVITLQRMCFTCSHYRADPHSGTHFCQLMDQQLASTELRIDCPDHSPAIPGS